MTKNRQEPDSLNSRLNAPPHVLPPLPFYSRYAICVSLIAAVLLAACSSSPISKPKPTGWTQDEVADSYVFAYPLVLMGVARDAAVGTGPGQAPLNTLRHAQALPPVGAANRPTPSVDTIDSSAWLDVSGQPVVVSLPNSRNRYVDARALDMWTNVLWSTTAEQTGARVTGIKAQTVAFVPQGWNGDLPKGMKRVEVPTRYVWLNIRVQSNGGRDLAAIRKLQREMRVAPLDVYAGAAEPADTPRSYPAGDMPVTGTPDAQVAALDPKAFFDRVAQALPDNPPSPPDAHALSILADFGVKPDEPVQFPTGADSALAAGLADGRARVQTAPSNVLTANGWSWFGDGVGNYGPDYGLRAYVAYAQPGIGTKDDEVRAIATVDSDGHLLNGANRYVIHFAPGQWPPVRGFWSITAYTKEGSLDDSDTAHVSVGDRRGLRRNRDGSVDVTVSSARRKGANWLPTPRGGFQLVMRLYAPKPQASDGTWQPPPIVRQ
ncbi:DUF1254 domain-containing protein [Paraburkholderia sp. SARCC-3016]|uniref:DUF1254 domain-containing protein n=1 Tax=Paraburkholderia sp. SARCC-3016 TaxID=3058611 RepID=UPI002808A9DF|nr:DUF1254 domain-containing protein [Paraburkholderia sp. SARCC-3016]MDQ7978490.1 DUF1254 domain-containing protein [Paraburkholderia sp. SARCC-3016]